MSHADVRVYPPTYERETDNGLIKQNKTETETLHTRPSLGEELMRFMQMVGPAAQMGC